MELVLNLIGDDPPHLKAVRFKSGAYLIGRSRDCDLRLMPNSVSWNHCLLVVADGTACVFDLHSRNGVWVNNERVATKRELSHGDHMRINRFDFQVAVEAPNAVMVPHGP